MVRHVSAVLLISPLAFSCASTLPSVSHPGNEAPKELAPHPIDVTEIRALVSELVDLNSSDPCGFYFGDQVSRLIEYGPGVIPILEEMRELVAHKALAFVLYEYDQDALFNLAMQTDRATPDL